MNTRLWRMSAGLGCLFVAVAGGQAPVITSFHSNGGLTWTNSVNSNSMYRVEWASQLDGPWYQTFQNIHTIDAKKYTNFAVAVPMFYRVVMVTNRSPRGMVWVEQGEFVMGDSLDGWPSELPVHTNFISGFWMDEAPVTKMKWDEVYLWATNNGYAFDNSGTGKTNTHPVYWVNWYDSVKWCNARSQKEGLTPCYYTGEDLLTVYKSGQLVLSNSWVNWSVNGYRLPTEAEWEKAARGGRQGLRFPCGDTIDHGAANYRANTNFVYDKGPTQGPNPAFLEGSTPYTSPCGFFGSNGYGLRDMEGNMLGWCWDRYASYSASYATDPHGPDTPSVTNRVARGGSWDALSSFTRCSCRSSNAAGSAFDWIGLRCVRGQ